MAKAEKNQNLSQFFITFKPLPELNNQYTIFGKIAGGVDVLDRLNKISPGLKNVPSENVKIIAVNILNNPYFDAKEKLDKLKQPGGNSNKNLEQEAIKTITKEVKPSGDANNKAVGKYMIESDQQSKKIKIENNPAKDVIVGAKNKKMDFSDW